MKKLLFIPVLALLLFSIGCNDTSIMIENPEKITTIELQSKSEQDTILYKVVNLSTEDEYSDVYYIMDENHLVVGKIKNNSGEIITLINVVFILIIIIGFLIIIVLTLLSFLDEK